MDDSDDRHARRGPARSTRRPTGSRAGSWRCRRADRRSTRARRARHRSPRRRTESSARASAQERGDRVLARGVDVAHPVAGRLLPHVARDRRTRRATISPTARDERAVAPLVLGPPPSGRSDGPLRSRRGERAVPPLAPAALRSARSSSGVPAAMRWRRAFGSPIPSGRSCVVDHVGAGLVADQVAAEVVPRRVHAAAVEVAVEHAGRHVAERERGRAHRAELLPLQHPVRERAQRDERVLDPLGRRGVQRDLVAERPCPRGPRW